MTDDIRVVRNNKAGLPEKGAEVIILHEVEIKRNTVNNGYTMQKNRLLIGVHFSPMERKGRDCLHGEWLILILIYRSESIVSLK